MAYLIPLKNITIGKVQELYKNGYILRFSYNCMIPYMEIRKG